MQSRVDSQKVVNISPWNNSCGLSAQAYYLAQELLNKKLTANQEQLLCQWFEACYAIKVTANQLRTLLSNADYFPSSLHHQFILGAVLDHVLKNPSYKGPNPYNPDGTTTQDVFRLVADSFDRNVVIQNERGVVIFDLGHEPLRPKKEMLQVYYHQTGKSAHYDVIAADASTAAKANRWNALTSADKNPDYAVKNIRNLPQENLAGMKALILASIQKIQTVEASKLETKGSSSTAAVTAVVKKPAKPIQIVVAPKPPIAATVDKAKRAQFLQFQQETINKLTDQKTPIKHDEKKWAQLVEDAKKEKDEKGLGLTPAVTSIDPTNYSVPDMKGSEHREIEIIKNVKVDTQKALDAEFAKKLQEEIYEEFKKVDAKQIDSDAKVAEELQRKFDAEPRRPSRR